MQSIEFDSQKDLTGDDFFFSPLPEFLSAFVITFNKSCFELAIDLRLGIAN